MKRSELKKILKPLIKEMIKEAIVEEGVLGAIIAETVRGTVAAAAPQQAQAPMAPRPPRAPSLAEQKILAAAGLPSTKATMMAEHGQRLETAAQGLPAYDVPPAASTNLVEQLKRTPGRLMDGNMMAPAAQKLSSPSEVPSQFAGVDPADSGVPLDAFDAILNRGGAEYWKALAFEGGMERTTKRKKMNMDGGGH